MKLWIKTAAVAIACVALLGGCRLSFVSNGEQNSQQQTSYAEDSSLENILNNFSVACKMGDIEKIYEVFGIENESQQNLGWFSDPELLKAVLAKLSFDNINLEYIDDISGQASINVTIHCTDFGSLFSELFSESKEYYDNSDEAHKALVEKMNNYEHMITIDDVDVKFRYENGKWILLPESIYNAMFSTIDLGEYENLE